MQIIETLGDMLTSKKFIASIAATIVAFVAKVGIELDQEATATVLAPFITYIVSQGIADHGKEKASMEGAVDAIKRNQQKTG